jgi:predicted GNAT family N-acyltransferase
MKVLRCSSPEEFLAETTSYRGLDPIRTNVLGSVAVSIINNSRSYDAYWWWLILSDEEEVVGAAMRTAPFGLQIGPMPLKACSLLASTVARDDDEFPWVVGNEVLVAGFLQAYRSTESLGSRRRFDRGRKSNLYELKDLRFPIVEGEARLATVDDVDLVDQWVSDFHFFTEGVARETDERDHAQLVTRLESGMMSLWCVRRVVVAMAGNAAPVQTPSGLVTRIGPVFTPAENRGRGYGSAITASLSRSLLDTGSRVMLYADADYPVSNRVYQTIGFQIIDEVVQYDVSTT